MRVRILRKCHVNGILRVPGDVVEIKETDIAVMIGGGIAEAATEEAGPDPVLEEVPDAPEEGTEDPASPRQTRGGRPRRG